MPPINRDIADILKSEAGKNGVLTLLGPTQIGKTALLRATFPTFNYADLEQPDLRTLAISEADQFFARFALPLIIDGIQQAPSFQHGIQAKMAQNPTMKGQLIIAGRYSEHGKKSPITGTILHLLPLSIKEIKKHFPDGKWDANTLILKGGLPTVHAEKLVPAQAYAPYCTKFIKHNVQGLTVVNEALFERFMKACATRVGQPLNISALGKDLGLSAENVEEWIAILEGSFIIFKLMPIEDAWGKKISKSPKVYFVDVGLACYLLGLNTADQLAKSPLYGSLYENLVIMDLIKGFRRQAKQPEIFFYKDAKGMEIDLLVKRGDDLIAIDIDPASTMSFSAISNLERFSKGIPVAHSYIIFNGESHAIKDKIDTLNFADCTKMLGEKA